MFAVAVASAASAAASAPLPVATVQRLLQSRRGSNIVLALDVLRQIGGFGCFTSRLGPYFSLGTYYRRPMLLLSTTGIAAAILPILREVGFIPAAPPPAPSTPLAFSVARIALLWAFVWPLRRWRRLLFGNFIAGMFFVIFLWRHGFGFGRREARFERDRRALWT